MQYIEFYFLFSAKTVYLHGMDKATTISLDVMESKVFGIIAETNRGGLLQIK